MNHPRRSMEHLSGFAPLAGRYAGFVLDLWGVIHDGVTPYPGAADALRRLRGAGRRVVLLSNAPRRAHVAGAALGRLGIPPDLYDAVVTSGEAAWTALGLRPGARLYHLGAARDSSVWEDRDVQLVEHPAEADLLLNTGPDTSANPDAALADHLGELQRCLAAGLPMWCVNPDLEIVSGGRRLICAGVLAQWYEVQGGAVRWFGKPFPQVYDLVWPLLGGLGRHDILAVGDALRTDVAGAQAQGMDCCWVLGGIHAHDSTQAAEQDAEAAGLAPVATVPAFVW